MASRAFYVFAAFQIIVAAAVLWMVFTRSGAWDLQRCLGAVLVVAGLGGIAVARYQLGKSFAFKPKAHELVTRGIYSKIRNPIYVFGTLLIAGFVLVMHLTAGWPFLLVIVVIQVLRARREAQVLEGAFGDAYRDYRRKTWL
jgi:protein-S-isoprenylcysteine O-methyltransferase Ste14